jgi:hypothetical protein
MRYSLRTLAEVVTVAAFILALAITWQAKSSSPGRYHAVMSEGDALLLDTATGELWSRTKGSAKFYPVNAPPWREGER